MKRLLAVVLLTTLPFNSIANDLFQWQQSKADNNTLSQLTSSHAYKSGKDFSINTVLLKKYKVNDQITINISSNENYFAKITKVKQKENGIQHIFAEINHHGEKTPVVMTLGKKQFFFRIVTKDSVLVAQGINNQGKLINEYWLSKVNNSNVSDVKIPQRSNQLQQQYIPQTSQQALQKNQLSMLSNHNAGQSFNQSFLANQRHSNKASVSHHQTNDEIATVGVLFVYSLSAETLYQGDVSTRLNHIVEVTNQIYIDSEVNIQIEIADTLAVDYSDDILSDEALDDITFKNNEAFTNIEDIRFKAGADMVAFLRPSNDADPVCGLAWGNNDVNNNINYMYSHTSIDCPDYVNAHELGHNMGLAHSLDQGDEGYSYPFARGYRISDSDNGFSTVMAYSTSNAAKIYKFSNPNILCTELPCGIDRNNAMNGADASYALNQLRFQLANIMDSEANLTLAADALNNVVNTHLKSCLESQINSYNITYAAQVQNLFCSYRNINSLTGIEGFTGLMSLYLDGNNLTDLSPLSSLKKLSTLSISNANISNLTPLSTITYLSNLTLANNQITTLSGLEGLSFLTYLNVTDNKIIDIDAISNNVALESILLDNNQIIDIEPLQDLVNMNWLSLNNNLLTELSSLTSLSQLTNVNLAGNEITSLNGLNTLRNIEYLNINNTTITDLTPIKSLRNLQTLSINNTAITSIDPLINLYNLTNLYAANNNIADISTLFNLHNSWSQINLTGSNNIYCWQVDYLTSFVDYDIYEKPNNCDASTDNLDNDEDGVSNRAELVNNTNPLYNNEQAGKVEFQIDQVSLEETSQTVNFKVIRTSGNMGEINVDVRTNNQSADAGEDFSTVNQTLTFTNNELYKTFSFDIIGDSIYENNESFEIELLNPEPATLGERSSLIVTLQEKGGVALTWSETSSEINENNNTLTLTVTRPNDSEGKMSVDIINVDNTAINGVDYFFDNQTITFSGVEYSKDIDVTILDNDEYQEDRTFSLEMTNPINAYIADNTQSAIIEILDDDTPAKGIIAFVESTLSFNENAGDININLMRVDGDFGELTVNYMVTDISATRGSDFTLNNGTLTFLAGEIEKTITFVITDDNSDENDESFTITLTADDNNTIGSTDEITINIVDNDETVVTTPTAPTNNDSGGGGTMYYLILFLMVSLFNSRKAQINHPS